MCFKSSWLKALKISLDASVYRDLGFSEDESFSFALTDNSSSVKGAAAISPEKLRAIKEAGKKRERELAALEQRQRKTREENPWIYEEAEKFRQEAARKREEARKKPLTCLASVGMHICPPYGFGLFYSHLIHSHRIKRSPIRKGRVSLDKAAQQKREDDLSSRFQHIELLISSYISRVPRWKGPSPCRSRCGQSFRGA